MSCNHSVDINEKVKQPHRDQHGTPFHSICVKALFERQLQGHTAQLDFVQNRQRRGHCRAVVHPGHEISLLSRSADDSQKFSRGCDRSLPIVVIPERPRRGRLRNPRSDGRRPWRSPSRGWIPAIRDFVATAGMTKKRDGEVRFRAATPALPCGSASAP